MRVLLDEDLPLGLARYLAPHQAEHCERARLERPFERRAAFAPPLLRASTCCSRAMPICRSNRIWVNTISRSSRSARVDSSSLG